MCVLRVSSHRKSLSDFLANTRLPYYESHDKADPQKFGRDKGKPYGYSGFKCAVSEASWSDLPEQIQDAVRFLKRCRKEFIRLRERFRGSDIQLDFPYELRIGKTIFAQFDCLPPELLKSAGELGIGIEMSLYPPSDGATFETFQRGKRRGLQ
jgi:hypothetical protein